MTSVVQTELELKHPEKRRFSKMTPEERKEYNKNYYLEHKDKIMTKALEKIECQFCHRKVIKNNLLKHHKSAICEREQLRLEFINRRLNRLKN